MILKPSTTLTASTLLMRTFQRSAQILTASMSARSRTLHRNATGPHPTHQLIARPSSILLGNGIRKINTSSPYLASEADFKKAVDSVPKLKDDPGNEVKLEMYALYKQATVGQCNTPRPGMMDFVGRAKHDAWTKLGTITPEEAKQKYIDIVNQLINEIGLEGAQEDSSSSSSAGGGAVESLADGGLLVERKNQVLWIRFNRPQKYNAVTSEMYETVTNLLNGVGSEKDIKCVVLTGEGEYYSAGNDLTNFITWAQKVGGGDMRSALPLVLGRLTGFVNAFIDCPKAVIGAVNGPALGIMATTLALADMIICSESAFFQTPFTSLGQSPEGCSTVTFPMIMGQSRASQMLLFNYKMSAREAYECGYVSRLAPADRTEFLAAVNDLLHGPQGIVTNCYPESLVESKKLVRTPQLKELLYKVNQHEAEILGERFLSDECAQAVGKFLSKRK